MKIPELSCKIEAYSSVNPSEDPKKIEQAVSNILVGCNLKTGQFSVSGTSQTLESLAKIHEIVQSRRSQSMFRRNLERNLDHNTTWFYLNKQAAFVNNVAICEEADESPLGPIKILLTSRTISQIIEWLTQK